MKLCRSILVGALSVAALFAVDFSAEGQAADTPNKVAISSSPRAVDEQEFVKIGGVEQWVSIRGNDRDAPVLLMVHGGPGAAWSGFSAQEASWRNWEKDFIVVCWDQRGAGRTFGRSGPVGDDISIERMAQDGVEVTQFVEQRLHKSRVILMGVSWGSVVGVYMVKARPDLFYAYVGTGQVVNWRKGEVVGYAQTLERARAAKDQEAIDALEKIGPAPYRAQRSLGVHSNWAGHFEPGAMTSAELLAMPFSAPGYSKADAQNWLSGLETSQDHFLGEQMDGPLERLDLTELGTNFAVPVFIFQGAEDDITPASLAKSFADALHAPKVQYVPIANAGHYAFITKPDLFLKLLNERVRPLASGPARPH